MSSGNNNRSAYITGLILIGIGLLFLLNSLGIATFRLWYFITRFWPILLILFGLNLILKKSKLWWVVPILIFVIVIGAVFMPESTLRGINTGFFVFNFGDEAGSGIYQENREYDPSIDNFRVNLTFGANRLNINSLDNNDDLFDLNLDYRGKMPEVIYNKGERKADLFVRQTRQVNVGTGSDIWDINLTKNTPLDINIKGGAGDLLLNLEKLKVDSLNIDAGLGQLNIRYPDYDNETEISAGAGNIKLIVPSTAALRIETKTVINSNNFDEVGLIKLYDDVYQSKNYGEVENKIDIKISTSAGNIKVEHN
ncbi:MAG: DUF5668 domain-containing protein [Halanaerobiales bacterium]|nr:DUF5668 domain-containing protein [Halanaerobiales bacterium]